MSGLERLTREELIELLLKLAKPYSKDRSAPQRVLAKRIERFVQKLFVFVQHPEVPSANNSAERAIRSAVVARKISGGIPIVSGKIKDRQSANEPV